MIPISKKLIRNCDHFQINSMHWTKLRRTAANSIFHRQIPVHLPIFVLKIVLILTLTIVCGILLFKNIVLQKELTWQPPPLILVPGLMGSKLYVEGYGIEYPRELRSKCRQKDIPFRKAWLTNRIIDETDCELLYLLSLSYDSTSAQFSNRPNVNITVNLPGIPFGTSLWPVQCLLTDNHPVYCDYSTLKGLNDNYMRRMAEFLISKLKYQVGRSLFAAPYDWRQHLNSDVMNEFYADLTFLVEHAVNSTGKKAIFLAHSMGNNVINKFLNAKVSKEWQQKYLSATINVAPPFGGVPNTLTDFLAGRKWEFDPLNESINNEDFVRFFRAMAFPTNLLPFKNAFGNEWLIKIGQRKYSAMEVKDFLTLVNSSHLWQFYAENEPKPQKYVPMYCVYGIGKNNTVRQTVYKSTKDRRNPQLIMGDGDGTVNAESIGMCKKWKDQGHTVSIMEFPLPGKSHTEILMNINFYKHIAKILSAF